MNRVGLSNFRTLFSHLAANPPKVDYRILERNVRRITGVKELAKEAKCSRTMIYNVARGRSTSARIAAILQKHGIAVETRPRAIAR